MGIHERDVFLHAIATSVPDYRYDQGFALDKAVEMMGDTEAKERFLRRVYTGSAIKTRYSVVADYAAPPEERTLYPKTAKFTPEPTTTARNQLFNVEANRLSVKAAEKLLTLLDRSIRERITHVITVSCTGVGAPGIDFALVKELGLASTVHRVHVGFMGCYAAFPALKLARDICRSDSAARVLVVCCEICSVHLQQKFELDVQVANALFADGVAATLVSSEPADSGGPRFLLNQFLTEIVPDSEMEMTWTLGQTGFDMRLSSYVPKLLETNIRPVMERLAERAGRPIADVSLWAIHPGGRAILEKIQSALGLDRSDLQVSYDVLRDYGNMSSATVLFVLNEILQRDGLGFTCAAAFGPGLTVETGWLEKVA